MHTILNLMHMPFKFKYLKIRDSEAGTSSFASTNSTGSQASNALASSWQVNQDKWLL